MQHRIDPGGQGVAAIALEPLQVAIVTRQHLRGAAISRLGQRLTLPRQRPLQLQQLGKVSRRGFPDRARSGKLPVLVHQRHPKPSAPRHGPAVGSASPAIRPNSVVLPLPFRPMIPHFSPRVTVKVTSSKRRVAPNSTATPESESWVTSTPMPIGIQ